MSDTTLTLCISGTDCWPDHALISRPAEEINTYNQRSGYIPSRLHELISTAPGVRDLSYAIPGCGSPYKAYRTILKLDYWALYVDPMQGGPADPEAGLAPASSLDPVTGYSVNMLAAHAMALIVGTRVQVLDDQVELRDLPPEDNPRGKRVAQAIGLKSVDEQPRPIAGSLRLHWREDDLASLEEPPQRWEQVNLVGHSRGGVIAIAITNLIALYLPHIKVNIIALDPVPGTGDWPENMCTLPGDVLNNYLGIYAADEVSMGFNAVVPRVLESQRGGPSSPALRYWDPLTDDDQPSDTTLTDRFQLIFSRGRHATIPGSRMGDGGDYSAKKDSDTVGAVGDLVCFLCQQRLRQWGVHGDWHPADSATIKLLKQRIDSNSQSFYNMRDFAYTTAGSFGWLGFSKARGISSTAGSNPLNWSYLEVYLPMNATREQGFSGNISRTANPHASWKALTTLPDSDFGSL